MRRERSKIPGSKGVDVAMSQTESSTEPRDEAERRLAKIKPLVAKPGRTRDEVTARASQVGLDAKTLYRWLAKYESTLDTASLARKQRSDRGATRLPRATEEIIDEALRSSEFHNTAEIAQIVSAKCEQQGIPVPHYNTLRARVNAFRQMRRAPLNSPAESSARLLPATVPVELAEISHLALEISVIDQSNFRVAKPWVTAALDCINQSVLGFWISTERPGTFEFGQCIACAILPKDELLSSRGITDKWPYLGPPAILNGELEKPTPAYLKQACAQYGITLKPNTRRASASCAQEFHAKLLSHFNPAGVLLSPRVLLFDEFQDQLVKLILSYNCERIAVGGIDKTEKYSEGVAHGRGTSSEPSWIADPAARERVRFAFMPFVERTVQHYGIMIDGISYSGLVLTRWMRAGDFENPKNNQKFLIRRDPRDIKTVWFLDPEKDEYFPLSWNLSALPQLKLPPLSWKKCLELKSRFRERWREDGITSSTFKAMLVEFMEALYKHRPKLPPETEAALGKLNTAEKHMSCEQPLVDKDRLRA